MCRILVEKIFAKYVVPLQIIRDRGLEFDTKLSKRVCEFMGGDDTDIDLQRFY